MALLLWLASCALAMDVGVSPAWIDARIPPGAQRDFEVTVVNNGSRAYAFEANLVDIILDPNTNDVIYRVDPTVTWSAESYVEVTPRVIALEPNSTVKLTLTVTAPSEPEMVGGRYSALRVRTLSRDPEPGAQARLGLQFTVPLLFTIGRGESHSIEVSAPPATAPQGAPVEVEVEVSNLGQTHERPVVLLALRDPEGNVASTHQLRSERFILPGQTRVIPVRWDPALPMGDYEVIGAVRYGSDSIPVASSLSIDAPVSTVTSESQAAPPSVE